MPQARRALATLLKADLHLHTSEGEAFIAYDAGSLIDRAARAGFQVLSITNHNVVTFSQDLAAYARARGILLIPGVEATIEGRQVPLYNIDVPLERIRSFADLRRLKRPEWLVVAVHPFFPGTYCLGGRLRSSSTAGTSGAAPSSRGSASPITGSELNPVGP